MALRESLIKIILKKNVELIYLSLRFVVNNVVLKRVDEFVYLGYSFSTIVKGAGLAMHNNGLITASWICQKGHENRIIAVVIRLLLKICGTTHANWVLNIEVKETLGLNKCVGVKMRKDYVIRRFKHIERLTDV